MHCGSSCDFKSNDELTTTEALDLIEQMKEVGLKHVTLSGGEPTTRSDIFILSKGKRVITYRQPFFPLAV
jgi:MoaA/NifB/PqqE/SkfB family radical SAM enzyme